MDEFLRDISSSRFWVSVVIVGILINLASAYLKTPSDKLLRLLSGSWRGFSEQRKARREELVLRALEDPEFRIGLRFQELRHRIRSTGFLVVAVFIGVLYLLNAGGAPEFQTDRRILLMLGAWMVLFSMSATEAALYCSDIVLESLRRAGKARPPFFMGD
jgi:hypothetical protein